MRVGEINVIYVCGGNPNPTLDAMIVSYVSDYCRKVINRSIIAVAYDTVEVSDGFASRNVYLRVQGLLSDDELSKVLPNITHALGYYSEYDEYDEETDSLDDLLYDALNHLN